MKMSKKNRDKWLVSDELWEEIEPLLPRHNKKQRIVGGRTATSDRQATNGIFFAKSNPFGLGIYAASKNHCVLS